jgi:hypothetical protein
MSNPLERVIQLSQEINTFPLGNCSPSDDPDKQVAYLYSFRDLVKRFISSAKRINDLQLKEMISSIHSSPKEITDAYDLKADLQGIIDYINDNFNNQRKDLLAKIDFLKNTMTSVSTGGQKIQDINDQYIQTYQEVTTELQRIGLKNPNPYSDLWEWYGDWSSGKMPQYKDRRTYVIQLFKELFDNLKNQNIPTELEIELIGWERIERSVGEIKLRLVCAENEEQFQAIGLICRETIISLCQQVYNAELHPSIDGITLSITDSKRMLESYISYKLPGADNENLRKYAKATNILANELTHKRTATIKLAKLCSSSCINLVNLIRILEE